MSLNDRQSKMAAVIKENKRISVKKLASFFYVSEMTVRRDLKELEIQGYIQRYNGGAMYINEHELLPIESRKLLHETEKKQIAEKAREYLGNSITVFIDSSSTCFNIIPILCEYKDITIFTNSVLCVLIAAKYHIKCVLSGGVYYENEMRTVGETTNNFLRNINPDVGFFSARGISDDGIISDSDEMQTSVKRAILANCKKKIFLFDASKQHKKYVYTLCKSDEVDKVLII